MSFGNRRADFADGLLHVVDGLEDWAFSDRYLRFRMPVWATPAQVDLLAQLGLVNGEAIERE